MATPNRATLLTRIHKQLKKHYQPVPLVDKPVLEQMLFAVCLENAHYRVAEQAVQALVAGFYDWNEVRVSSVKELTETLSMLPDPATAGTNLKRVLQSLFETTYSFDMELLKKKNLGEAANQLKKIEGCTHFAVAYVTQASLGGHAIAVDRGTLQAFAVLGAATAEEVNEGVMSGLERAIPKNKGAEFASLIHQLGADFVANPYAPALHKLLLEIAPDGKDRLPKRGVKKEEPPKKVASAPVPAAAKTDKPNPVEKNTKPEKADKKPQPAPAPAPVKKPPATSKGKPPEPVAKKPEKRPSASDSKKKPTKTLAKRKPR